MKFELDEPDKALLLFSGAACAAYGTAALVAPSKLAEITYETRELPHDPTTRWFGLSMGSNTAAQLVVAASDDKKVIKNGLKVAGGAWLASSAMMAYNGQEGIQKREMSFATAAGMAAMGALCLWRGFREEDEE